MEQSTQSKVSSAQGAEAHSTETFFKVEKSSHKTNLSSLEAHPLSTQIYRDDEQAIKLLAQNIKEHSLINRIIVNKNLQILSGNLRVKALSHLNIQEIEVDVVEVPDELEFIISSNHQRVKTFFDMRNEIQSLYIKYSEGQGKSNGGSNTIKKIATITGYPTGRISTIRKIDSLHPDFLIAIDEGKISLNGAKTRCDYIVKLLQMEKALSKSIVKGTDPFKVEEIFEKEMLDHCHKNSLKQYDMLKTKEMTAAQAFEQIFKEKKEIKVEPRPEQSGMLKEDCSCPLCSGKIKDKDLTEFILKYRSQIEASINQLKKV